MALIRFSRRLNRGAASNVDDGHALERDGASDNPESGWSTSDADSIGTDPVSASPIDTDLRGSSRNFKSDETRSYFRLDTTESSLGPSPSPSESTSSSSIRVEPADLVRRTKSLPDLRASKKNSGPTARRLHPLQWISRRMSLDADRDTISRWPGHLVLDYSENGIHTCSHCQKVNIDLRILGSRFNPRTWWRKSVQGSLGVTYRQARRAAVEGCQFFLSIGEYHRRYSPLDPRLHIKDMSRSRHWYFRVPDDMLDRPVSCQFDSNLRSRKYGHDFDTLIIGNYLERAWRTIQGDLWSTPNLNGTQLPHLII